MAKSTEEILTVVEKLIGNGDWTYQDGKGRQTVITDTVMKDLATACKLAKNETVPLSWVVRYLENLGKSPAHRGMKTQYKKILEILAVQKGNIHHPLLKGMSFEELALCFGWLVRLYKADGSHSAFKMPAVKEEQGGKAVDRQKQNCKAAASAQSRRREPDKPEGLDPWKAKLAKLNLKN